MSTFDNWEHNKHFVKVRSDTKNVVVNCKICNKELSTSLLSTSNLKKHLEGMHPSSMEDR